MTETETETVDYWVADWVFDRGFVVGEVVERWGVLVRSSKEQLERSSEAIVARLGRPLRDETEREALTNVLLATRSCAENWDAHDKVGF